MSDRRSVLKRRLEMAFRALLVVSTVAGLWWFLRGLDFRELAETFQSAQLLPLVVAVLLNFCGQLVRAEAWQIMLGPRYPIPYRRLVRYELAAQAASAISPARAGELLRLWLLNQDNVPFTTTGALIVLKKVLGGVGLVLLVVGAPWFVTGLPGWLGGFVVGFTGFMLVQLAVLTFIAHRAKPDKLPKFLRGVVGGMYFLRDRRRMPAAVVMMLLGEVTDAAAVVVVLQALNIDLSIAAALMILFMIDFANMMPIAPGHLGTFEVGALYALDLMHVPQDSAVAFTLLFHAQQVLPQIVVGLPLELRLLIAGRRAAHTLPSAAAEPEKLADQTSQDGDR